MKYFIHGLVFMFAFQAFSAQGQPIDFTRDNKIDTINTMSWQNEAWVKGIRIYNSYNEDCSVKTTTIQNWYNNAWGNVFLHSYTYLPSKKPSQSTTSQWNAPDWVPYMQNIYTYDGNGYLVKDVVKTWNGADYKDLQSTDYKNNTAGFTIAERTRRWNGTDWINADSTSYILNGENQITSSLNFEWEVDHWENYLQTTGTFSGGLLTVVIDQLWENNEWVDDSRSTITYDDKERIKTMHVEDRIADKWVNVVFSDYSYTTACSALPLALLSFEATQSSGDISLQWETTNEINTSGFDIERSTDGINFQAIGVAQATGSRTLNHYSYTDKIGNKLHGIIYYRLRMTDVDGKFSLSNVEKVNIDSRESLVLFPNPVRDELGFVLSSKMQSIEVRIMDQIGNTLIQKRIENITPGSRNKIDVSFLPVGIYMIRLAGKNYNTTQRFVKQ